MQNKGIVKFIAVALVLICCFYLSFSFVTSYHDNKIAALAKTDSIKAREYKDSVETHNVWLWSWNLKECREMEIGLGLDLKGGMNVILEVSEPDILDVLADHSQDPTFKKALSEARQESEGKEVDFVDVFVDKWKSNNGKALASVFATSKLRDKVNSQSSDKDVIAALKEEVKSAIDNAENVVRNRVDKFGVVQPNIQRLGTQSRIMVEMPGVKDKDRVLKLLAGSANLEFWECYNGNEVYNTLQTVMNAYTNELATKGEQAKADETEKQEEVAETVENAETVEGDSTEQTSLNEEMAKKDTNTPELNKEQDKLMPRLMPYNSPSAVVGLASVYDTASINRMIRSDVAQQILRNLPDGEARLVWGAKPAEAERYNGLKGTYFELYALKVTDPSGRAPLEGDVITSAKDGFDNSKPIVSMQMNTEGTRIWAELTKKNLKRCIAVVLDDVVYTAPTIQTEITGGQSQISGNFTIEETKDLANTLNSGKMPAPTRVISYQMVGPSLGAQSIHQGIVSFIVAFILLMCVMVLLYNFIPGMLANCALLFNLFFTIGILASFQAALTMPGIAGIVLTLGTAVDANVLIYERTKEELRKGLGVRDALNNGYSNAFSAIFDSNLTSLITGIILYVFGTGPIRGFATTLIIGICVSFFTAVFMTRLVYDNRMKKNKWQNLTFTTPFSKNLMQNTKFNFMGKYKTSYMVWGLAALIFCGSFVVRGLSRSIDFTGGRNYIVKLDKDVPVEDVRKVLKGAFVNDEESSANKGKEANTQVIALGEAKTIRVSTNWNIEATNTEVDARAEEILYNKFVEAGFINKTTSKKEFLEEDEKSDKATIVEATKVGPSMAKTITRGAFISVIIALIAIFLYILVRFRNVAFSVGSIVALFFDALVVLGFFSLLHGWVPMSLEIDQTFIGAILTVIGYSINDKVVVFDRIRENMGLYSKRDRRQLFNESLNQTLARTINTSVTTLIVLLTIFFLGGDSIRPFSFAMILGVVFGTLSSIFIAAPTAYLIMSRGKKQIEEKN